METKKIKLCFKYIKYDNYRYNQSNNMFFYYDIIKDIE